VWETERLALVFRRIMKKFRFLIGSLKPVYSAGIYPQPLAYRHLF